MRTHDGSPKPLPGIALLAALTLFSGAALADDEHPHMTHDVAPLGKHRPPDKPGTTGNSDLGSKLANPSAPVMGLNSFIDIKQYNGTAPDARGASFTYTFQPAIPFPTKLGNVILRPAIPIEFSEPYIDQATGNVQRTSQFGNITLDTLWGKTLKNGLMIMGGTNNTFKTGSKWNLRADWAIGPELVIGHASPKNGNTSGLIINYTWSFPQRNQTMGGQYFYAINLKDGWQIAAAPIWSWNRAAKTVRFPLGTGFRKVAAIGKKNFPLQLGVEAWLFTPPPGGTRAGPLGPEWQIRFRVSPVVPLPWRYLKKRGLEKSRAKS